MDKTRWVEFTLLVTGGILGAFIYLNEHHADDERTKEKFVLQEQKIIEQDHTFQILLKEQDLADIEEEIDELNAIRYHYEELSKETDLLPAQDRRLGYLVREIEKKEGKKERTEDNIDKLKQESQ